MSLRFLESTVSAAVGKTDPRATDASESAQQGRQIYRRFDFRGSLFFRAERAVQLKQVKSLPA